MSAVAWDRQPGEPMLWFDRFETFRLLGLTRTLNAAARQHLPNSRKAGGAWQARAREWRWVERAEAWDAAEHARLRSEEEERRRAAREERIRRIHQVCTDAAQGLQAADLGALSAQNALDKKTARALLGSLRILFFEAVRAERLELGLPTQIVEGEQAVTFRADDLAAAQRELEAWRAARGTE